MEYLRRSGRVPAAITAIGGLLSIKPGGRTARGQSGRAARTTRQTAQALLDFVLKLGPLRAASASCTSAEARARDFSPC